MAEECRKMGRNGNKGVGKTAERTKQTKKEVRKPAAKAAD
jgi:hypothetical protein